MTETQSNVDHLEISLTSWRKRLIYRSWHRGTKEMDLLMGNFADQHVHDYGIEQLREYEAVLEINDPELYDMYMAKTMPNESQKSAVLTQFLTFSL